MTIQGIDVAGYQSSTFSTTGLSFVFIKATEGTGYINPKQAAQTAHARAKGVTVGFYHFLHPGNVLAQAQYFVAHCDSVAGDILACDWEPTTSGTASNADKDNFIKLVKSLRPGHRVVLYCDTSRWKNADQTSYAGDGLWIADPNHPAGHPGIASPWLFHQYGIRGTDVDLGNFANMAALVAWATNTTPEEDMPLAKADVSTIASTDGVFLAPADAADYSPSSSSPGHYWSLGTHVNDQTTRIRHVDNAMTSMAASLAALSAAVGALAKDGGLSAAEIQVAAEAGAKAALAELGAVLQQD